MSAKVNSFLAFVLALGPGSVVYGQGLKGEYFANMTLSGAPAYTRIEAVDFNWGANSPGDPLGANAFSVRWTGSITPLVSGDYTFTLASDDGSRLWVGGDLIVNFWSDHALGTRSSAPVSLEAGQAYGIKVEFYENGGDAVVQL